MRKRQRVTACLLVGLILFMGFAPQEATAAHKHSYKVVKIKASTCKKTGKKYWKCSCGAKKTTKIAKKHKYKLYKTKKATCEKKGTKYYKCRYCSSKTTKSIAKRSHSYKLYKTKKATYTAKGYKLYKCSCGVSKKTTLAKLSYPIKFAPEPKIIFTAPLEADFKDNYDKANVLYKRLTANNGERFTLVFESQKEMNAFNDMIFEKIFCEAYPVFGHSIFKENEVEYIYGGFDEFYEQETERVSDAKLIYNACKKAGLYNGMSEREAVKKINLWICQNMKYKLIKGGYIEALKTGIGKCNAYAGIFEEMCKTVNIECQFVTGTVGADKVGHAWNRVKIGNDWYWVDTCWNDTCGNTSKYLLSEDLWTTHDFGEIER